MQRKIFAIKVKYFTLTIIKTFMTLYQTPFSNPPPLPPNHVTIRLHLLPAFTFRSHRLGARVAEFEEGGSDKFAEQRVAGQDGVAVHVHAGVCAGHTAAAIWWRLHRLLHDAVNRHRFTCREGVTWSGQRGF